MLFAKNFTRVDVPVSEKKGYDKQTDKSVDKHADRLR